MSSFVDEARELAWMLLANALPQRWSHTARVATTAERLARVLVPDNIEHIVAAAWLHDIGYAPSLVDTGFHPIDGAAYLARRGRYGLSMVANLVAHHTGAVFEAQERGLQDELDRYRFPVNVVDLAIVNCADLCTGPSGKSMDPDDRIVEVLTRYPADHPVHRAVARSAPVLVAQARVVLGAAEAARYAPRRVALPEWVECVDSGRQWRAFWSSDYHHITAHGPLTTSVDRKGERLLLDRHSGVQINLSSPPAKWSVEDTEWFIHDLQAATDAAAGEPLWWHQYRAFSPATTDGQPHRGADQCVLTPWRPTTTFYFGNIVELFLDATAHGRSTCLQQRTFQTLGDVSEWTDIAHVIPASPLDLRGSTQHPALDSAAATAANPGGEQPS
ncbi:MAG: HD domain-containing protein [Mycobacterium sp.]